MMKKIKITLLAVTCSLALSSCSNDDWACRTCELHGYPKVSPAAEVVVPPPAPTPPPALEKTLYEREVISPLPPPAPKKHKKKRKVDVREAS